MSVGSFQVVDYPLECRVKFLAEGCKQLCRRFRREITEHTGEVARVEWKIEAPAISIGDLNVIAEDLIDQEQRCHHRLAGRAGNGSGDVRADHAHIGR
jgi:hypothetical protein